MKAENLRQKWQNYFSDPTTSRYLIHRLLSENFSLYARRYVFAFSFMALVATTTALSAWIMRDVINEIFVKKDFDQVLVVALFVMAIYLTKGAATFMQTITLARVGNAIVADMQRRLFRHFMIQGADFYHDYPSSELITRISHNAMAARQVMDMLVTSMGRDLLSLIGLIIVMISQNPTMSLIAFVIAPIAILTVSKLIKRVKTIARDQFASLTQTTHVMQESALGFRIIRTFGLNDIMAAKMDEAIEGVEQRTNKIANLSARTSPLMETLGGFAFALVIIYCGWQTILGDQTPGEFMSFLTALLLAYDPAKRLSRLQVNIEGHLVGVRLMFEILDRPTRLIEKDDAKALDITKGEIEFSHVHFAYDQEEPILKDLSLKLEGHKTTALVGPSGGGKSTIMGLVQRFHDVTEGSVRIDGQDVRDLTLQSLNSHIALVTQDTILFTGTIRENIRFGKLDATDAEIEQAAKDAFAHDFIMRQPNGYETEVDENASNLSGGQKQRIAIARAMIKDAPIILLDEATSALDSESEAKVQAAFDRLSEGRTTMVIAHRLSTIRNADKICVVKDGHILEEGTHEELNAKEGVYANLVKLQIEK